MDLLHLILLLRPLPPLQILLALFNRSYQMFVANHNHMSTQSHPGPSWSAQSTTIVKYPLNVHAEREKVKSAVFSWKPVWLFRHELKNHLSLSKERAAQDLDSFVLKHSPDLSHLNSKLHIFSLLYFFATVSGEVSTLSGGRWSGQGRAVHFEQVYSVSRPQTTKLPPRV